jgi:hypothetical protein
MTARRLPSIVGHLEGPLLESALRLIDHAAVEDREERFHLVELVSR